MHLSRKTIIVCLGISTGLCLVGTILTLLVYVKNLKNDLVEARELLNSVDVKPTEQPKVLTEQELIKKKQLDYVLSDVLPLHPSLGITASEIPTSVYSYALKGHESGWLLETKRDGYQDFYLISDLVQAKLEDVMVAYIGQRAVCTTTKVVTTGNEPGLGRSLKDKNGYIVIAGEACDTYGGGNSIAVYSLTTGKKIKLTGSFSVAGTTFNATTKLGTTVGKLIGVYGVERPQLVVSYGDGSWDGTVEEVRQMAFFDLQTGKLIQVLDF